MIIIFLIFIVAVVSLVYFVPTKTDMLLGFLFGIIGSCIGYLFQEYRQDRKEARAQFDAFIEEMFRNLAQIIQVEDDNDVRDSFELDAWNNLKTAGLIIKIFPQKEIFLKINTYGMNLKAINQSIAEYFAFRDYFFQNNNPETQGKLESKRIRLVADVRDKKDSILNLLKTIKKELTKKGIWKYSLDE